MFDLKKLKDIFEDSVEDKEEYGIPKRDGSGRGMRANRGRGGCIPTRNTRRRL